MNIKRSFVIVLLAIMLTACSRAASLQVEEAWARPVPAGGNGGVFFTIENPTDQPDRLLSATAPVAEVSELHMSMMQGGVMSMQPQEAVEVPPRSTVRFEPGGLHVMLIGVRQDLKAGDTFPLTLHFEKSGDIQVTVTIKQP
jgi:copper(I)-binding protein